MDRLRDAKMLVTGASGGIGEAILERLVARGAHVIAHARDLSKLDLTPGENKVAGDLASLAEVARIAREVPEVDVLVNNAGIGFGATPKKREESRDGFELRFAVNYLAAFLLTELVDAKAIVHVASAGQAPLDRDDLMMTRSYDGVLAYRRSKLAMVMDGFERARRDPSRPCVSLHPGTFLATKMVHEAGIQPLGTAAEGGDAVLHAIDAALAGKTGVYFDGTRETRADRAAYGEAAQAWLRETSLALTAPFRSK
jgi:NAD(P)-dependent dehydrogenase (short-subunit alcohol dehydrogenase family)